MITSSPFPLPRPADLALGALNALLRREDWARHRLAEHAGKSLRLLGGIRSLQATVSSEGLFQACDPAVMPDVTIALPVDRLRDVPGLWRQGGMRRLSSAVHIQGDAGFAQLVSDLARDLRWDIEDDLAARVGDVAARRLTQGVGSLGAGLREAAGRARDNLVEFLGEESGLLLQRQDFQGWQQDIEALRARLDQLERHVAAHGGRAGKPC